MSEDFQEVPPQFDPDHYPDGVNSKFYTMNKEQLLAMFGGEKGIFHNKDQRDIARCTDVIAETVVALGLEVNQSGAAVSNDGAANGSDPVTVCELGCGTALITQELAKALHKSVTPLGKKWSLLGTEVSPGFVSLAEEQVATWPEELKSNVNIQHHPPKKLPEGATTGTVDVVPIIDVYHHLEFPRTLMRDIRRALKPGGAVLLIDFIRDTAVHKSHEGDWVLKHVRGDMACFTEEITSCGFELVKEVQIPGLEENYVLHFRAV